MSARESTSILGRPQLDVSERPTTRFYLPFWPADKIYEKFDPSTEEKSGLSSYLWKVFEKPSIDGILVSRVKLETHKSLT